MNSNDNGPPYYPPLKAVLNVTCLDRNFQARGGAPALLLKTYAAVVQQVLPVADGCVSWRVSSLLRFLFRSFLFSFRIFMMLFTACAFWAGAALCCFL